MEASLKNLGLAEKAEENHQPPTNPEPNPVIILSKLLDSYESRSNWVEPSMPIGIRPMPIINSIVIILLSLSYVSVSHSSLKTERNVSLTVHLLKPLSKKNRHPKEKPENIPMSLAHTGI